MTKEERYLELVQKRKNFKFSSGLINPAEIDGGRCDCDHVEAWAQWMGNLNAKIMLVGKDFGGSGFLIKFRGKCDPCSVTNKNLIQLFRCLGVDIGNPSRPNHEASVFFTNAIFGVINTPNKGKNPITETMLKESAIEFLGPLIDIVNPKLIIAMGKESYQGLSIALGLPRFKSVDEAQRNSPIISRCSRLIFQVYHCSPLGLANRSPSKQHDDWQQMHATILEKVPEILS